MNCIVDWIENESGFMGACGWFKCDEHGTFMDEPYNPIVGNMPDCPKSEIIQNDKSIDKILILSRNHK